MTLARFFLLRRWLGLVVLLGTAACTFMPPPPAELPSRSGIQAGRAVVVGKNETVYSVAQAHNVSMRELIVLNDLKPPFNVVQGQKLFLPQDGENFAGGMKPPSSSPYTPVERRRIAKKKAEAIRTQTAEKAETKPTRQKAAVAPVLPKEPASNIALSVCWPVRGPVLSRFGAKENGLNNDGINIGAPNGAPVVAAASGIVVYAGNDMKGFGNLILIRHQGDWVTAYAHLGRVLVRKDSIVAQGDMIGRVGKTGNVASPQVHFEIRKDGHPIDPLTVIEKRR
ncbi:MAG: M23 family metallopeptidase [Alphaproteobacteria bacterium]|nr:M23 family metallopeptidase [Alphaproteobacteria bacterium]